MFLVYLRGRCVCTEYTDNMTTVVHFLFRLVNIRQKIILIFAQIELNENNFASRVWWALIALCAEEMAVEKEMACCVRFYHINKVKWAAAIQEVVVCRCWCVVVGGGRKFLL